MSPGGSRRSWPGLLVARVLAASGLLGSATFARLRNPDAIGLDALFLLAAVAFALTAVHALSLRTSRRRRWLLDAQMAADAMVVSVAVLLTGGVDSWLVPLYVLPVVGAAMLEDRRAGLLVAALNTVLYGSIIALQYNVLGIAELAPIPGLAAPSMPHVRQALLTLALHGAGFACVAWLTGYLSERLRHSDERLRQASSVIADLQAFNQCVIDSLTGGLATADPGGAVLTFNRAAELITGWTAEEARGRSIETVLQLPGELVTDLPRMGASGSARRLDVEYGTRNGRHVDLGLTAAPLKGATGGVGFLFTFQDITERKRQDREAQTERRLAALGEMAAGIAHEIRNPLASMSGSIQVLRQELGLSTEQSRLMDIVLRESERLNTTIGNFLAYARPARHQQQAFDLGRVIQDAAVLLCNSAERRAGQEVVVGPAVGPCLVRADEAQMRQVVWNLATNGLKAMPNGGRLELSVGTTTSGAVTLTVRDEGVGIAAADLDRVFEPFRSTFPGGSGLGLSIVHRIVSDAGGTIEVQSAPGRGTAVRVTLPVARDIEAAEPAPVRCA